MVQWLGLWALTAVEHKQTNKSKVCDDSIRTAIQINGREKTVQKQTHTCCPADFQQVSQFSGGKKSFQQTFESKKLTQNGSKIKIYELNL